MARNNDQIPFGRCQVRAVSFADPDQQLAIWTVLAELSAITHYGFQDWLLNCTLGLDSPWRPLVNVDLSGLKLLGSTSKLAWRIVHMISRGILTFLLSYSIYTI